MKSNSNVKIVIIAIIIIIFIVVVTLVSIYAFKKKDNYIHNNYVYLKERGDEQVCSVDRCKRILGVDSKDNYTLNESISLKGQNLQVCSADKCKILSDDEIKKDIITDNPTLKLSPETVNDIHEMVKVMALSQTETFEPYQARAVLRLSPNILGGIGELMLSMTKNGPAIRIARKKAAEAAAKVPVIVKAALPVIAKAAGALVGGIGVAAVGFSRPIDTTVSLVDIPKEELTSAEESAVITDVAYDISGKITGDDKKDKDMILEHLKKANINNVEVKMILFYEVDKRNDCAGFILQVKGENSYKLALNGTKNLSDLKHDLLVSKEKSTIGIGETHKGFTRLAASTIKALNAFLKDKNSDNFEMTITGHSMGAAVSMLAYYDMIHNFPKLAERTMLELFGAPRSIIFDHEAMKIIAGKKSFSNVTFYSNSRDPVSNSSIKVGPLLGYSDLKDTGAVDRTFDFDVGLGGLAGTSHFLKPSYIAFLQSPVKK